MKHSESIIKDFLMRLKADKLSLGQFLQIVIADPEAQWKDQCISKAAQ